MAATAKVITLKGDPRNPESAEHIILFPGGSISVCRTTDNEYWAHIEVNKDQVIHGATRESMFGEVIDARVDRERSVDSLPDLDTVRHIAVRIQTKGGRDGELG